MSQAGPGDRATRSGSRAAGAVAFWVVDGALGAFGVAAAPLYIAWLNRAGPGLVCR